MERICPTGNLESTVNYSLVKGVNSSQIRGEFGLSKSWALLFFFKSLLWRHVLVLAVGRLLDLNILLADICLIRLVSLLLVNPAFLQLLISHNRETLLSPKLSWLRDRLLQMILLLLTRKYLRNLLLIVVLGINHHLVFYIVA